MARLGAFCYPATGHFNPMTALAHSLQLRGHEVVIFGIADAEARVPFKTPFIPVPLAATGTKSDEHSMMARLNPVKLGFWANHRQLGIYWLIIFS